MNKFDKVIRAAVAVAAFWFLYSFIVRNQLVVEFVRPNVESGNLGFASANILTSLLEVLVAVGGVILLGLTKMLDMASRHINSQVERVRGVDSLSSQVTTESQDPQKLTADLSRLLIQSVLEGNRLLTIQLAHRLAKKRFLDVDGRDQT